MIRSFGSSHKQTIYDNAVEVYEKIFNVKLDQNTLVKKRSGLAVAMAVPIWKMLMLK